MTFFWRLFNEVTLKISVYNSDDEVGLYEEVTGYGFTEGFLEIHFKGGCDYIALKYIHSIRVRFDDSE